jgi:hypothetical protein
MSSTASSPSTSAAPTRARRPRVLWDSDSTTRGGKTSIAILLEWLTTPGNYARWRDGKSQTGETREALCSEIKQAMRQHGIHHRENANIRTQISELERGFDAARVWLQDNGFDTVTFRRVVDMLDEDGNVLPEPPAEAHVLRMCRYYHQLNEVFGQEQEQGLRPRRAYSRTFPVPIKKRKLPGEEEQQLEPATLVTETVVEQRAAEESIPVPLPTKVPVVPIAPSPAVSGAASVHGNGGTPVASGAIPTSGLTAPWTNSATLESTQRMLAEAVREERDRKRFCMEEERHKLECEKLRCEVEAAKLKLTLDRALARKTLLDAGLLEADVNKLLS